MANTVQLISSGTVGAGGAASIDFTSIPQTYDDLMAVVSIRSAGTGGPESYFILASFNGLTTNRTYRRAEATGSSNSSDTGSSYPVGVAGGSGGTVSTFANGGFYISNYKSTSANKSYSAEWGSEHNSTANWDVGMIAGLWSSTSAITSISITTSSTNLAQHSTAYLYGIKKS